MGMTLTVPYTTDGRSRVSHAGVEATINVQKPWHPADVRSTDLELEEAGVREYGNSDSYLTNVR